MVYQPAHRHALHPGTDQRNALADKKEPVIPGSQGSENTLQAAITAGLVFILNPHCIFSFTPKIWQHIGKPASAYTDLSRVWRRLDIIKDIATQLHISHEPELTEIIRISCAMTRRPIVGGNTIELLRNGEQAYPAMLAAIDKAQTSLFLSTYIFETNKTPFGAGKKSPGRFYHGALG